jgi:ribosome biogenesis protein SSF1/2
VSELRKVMGPNTAMNLKEKKFNRMKDYEAVAAQLNISHLLLFSETESHIIFRVGKHPNGPTLHFRVQKFLLQKQVKATQKRPFESFAACKSICTIILCFFNFRFCLFFSPLFVDHTPPLLVLNNFSQAEENHVKLMKITFQNMFRTINVKTVKLSDCRRVVLFHYHKEDGTVQMRHYAIRANPVGISRNVKKIIQSKVPNLAELDDVSQYLDGATAGSFSGSLSDSEAEDEGSRVTLPDRYVGRGNAKSQLSAMKLIELGPRLTLELYKVQQGLNEGDILYHKFVKKSSEEAAATKARIDKAKRIKEERKKIQDQNVKRKREALEEKRQAKAERKKQRLENGEATAEDEDDDDESEEEGSDADPIDDENEEYEEEEEEIEEELELEEELEDDDEQEDDEN